MHTILQDLSFALRSLRRSRGFVILAVVSLGLALGVTTTIFGIVDTALNPVVPVREGDRLVTIWNAGDGANHDVGSLAKSDPVIRNDGFFDGIVVVAPDYAFLRIERHTEERTVASVGPNFFKVTGIQPFLGRSFAADGVDAVSGRAAMISFDLWRKALGGDRDLSDATVTVEDRTYQVVGVLPPNLPGALGAGVLLPMRSNTLPANVRNASMIARLRAGSTAASTQAHLRTTIDPVLTATFGVGRRPFRFVVQPALDSRPEDMDDLHRILLVSGILVLIIACGNMANLMLARGLARERDYALCFALGARRPSIVRQTLIEGLICAIGGALVGVIIAIWAFDLVTYRMTREVPGLGALAVTLNWRIFGFSFVSATVTSLAFALLPALRTSNVDLGLPLKSGAGTTTGRARSRYSTLVIGEVALTMTLMLGASLLLRAVSEMRSTRFGYNPRGLLEIGVYVRQAPITTTDSVVQAMVERVRALPGATGASILGTGSPAGGGVTAALASGGTRWLFLPAYTAVGSEHLRTLGLAVVQGRDFVAGDAARGAVILNETAARHLWPGETAVGRLLKLGAHETGAPWVPVVGISRDLRAASTVMPSEDPISQLWIVPPPGVVRMNRLVVRVPEGREADLRVGIEQLIRQTLPPNAMVFVDEPLREFDETVLARDFIGKLFVVFGGIALGLAACGLYCLLAFVVAQRRREFAVRIALGATRAQIARMILHDGAVMVLAGTGIGAFLAMWLARALDSMLYSVFYTDALSLVIAELLLIVVALVACLVPARRAARAQPVEMLRAI